MAIPIDPEGQTSQTDPAVTSGQYAATTFQQVPATLSSTHQMMVAIAIMVGMVMIATVVADANKTAGNVLAASFGVMLLVQGITHVNPFVAWVAKHPLTPSQTGS